MSFEYDAPPAPFQFTLRTLLIVMAAVGILCGIAKAFGLIAMVISAYVGLVGGAFVRHKINPKANALTLVELLVLSAICSTLVAILMPPAISVPHGSGRRNACAYNLHTFAVGFLAYHRTFGTLPPAYLADSDGRPRHSWRVLILPYVEENWLRTQYHLDEPWDGPTNCQLRTQVPYIFQCPSDAGNVPGQTNYLLVTGLGTLFPGDQATSLVKFGGDPNKTIMLVEVANSGVNWLEPRDLDIRELVGARGAPPGKRTSSDHPGGRNVAFADGHVEFLDDKSIEQLLGNMLKAADAEAKSKVTVP